MTQSHPEAFNLSDFVSLTTHTHNRVSISQGKGLKTVFSAAQDMEPRLVLLSRGPELYSTRRLATEAERAGWMVNIIDPLALTIVVDEDGGRVFHKGWPVEC